MTVQDLYFRIMRMACTALSSHSDPWAALAFGRLGNTLGLMDLRIAGQESLTVDRKGSGLPILNEAVSLMLDLRGGVACADDPEAVRREMLDYMMARRRRPEAGMVSRMQRSLYARALDPPPFGVFATEPDEINLGTGPWGGYAYGAWDFWDGVSASPVSVRCGFEHPETVPDDAAEKLVEAARLFSGAQFKPVTLAHEIDERIPELRLKELLKMTIGPFRSAVFTDADDAMGPYLAAVEDSEMAWTLSFTIETLRSAGTSRRNGGSFLDLFRAPRPYERFAVDTLDVDRAGRGVSDFDVHTLMPHAVYQAMADAPDGARLLQGRRVHVLSGPECTLTEDV